MFLAIVNFFPYGFDSSSWSITFELCGSFYIAAMVFNDDGRHAENEVWSKYMYGAFSGPR